MKSFWQRPIIWIIIALILAAGLKFWLASGERVPFNADEAIVALMARHILQGERPIFFYGQAYMGSLDAWLAAAGFALFGQHVWVIRLVQGLLYLAVLLTTGWLGKRAFGSWWVGAIAMLLLAFPPVNVSLYTTASLGGYGEALLLGNLILLVSLRIVDETSQSAPGAPRYRLWLALGVLCGMGLWAFGLALVYAIPLGIWLLWTTYRSLRGEAAARRAWLLRWLALAIGGIVGALPWVLVALQYGASGLLAELSGGAIAGVERLPWILTVGQHIFGFLLLGVSATLGFRPPWSADWLALPLLPFMLILWMAVLGHMLRVLRRSDPLHKHQAIVAGVMASLVLAFILTPFGADPSGRYFLPLAIPLALFAAQAFWAWGDAKANRSLPNTASNQSVEGATPLNAPPPRGRSHRWITILAIILVMVFQLWGNIQTASQMPPGVTTQFYKPSQVDMRAMPALMDFLQRQGETRGYTNYWVAYPLAFLSQETIIFTPRLPYHLDFRHTERDNRYLPYNAVVDASPRRAYITTHHPELDDRLRQAFTEQNVSWQEAQIGDFHIFYHLSQPVRIELTGFGVTTNP